MRVIAVHAFAFDVQEFDNVTSILWNEDNVNIIGTKVGTSGSAQYTLSNSIYYIRIIQN